MGPCGSASHANSVSLFSHNLQGPKFDFLEKPLQQAGLAIPVTGADLPAPWQTGNFFSYAACCSGGLAQPFANKFTLL